MIARAGRIASLVILCQAGSAFGADIVFSGSLERLRRESISVRLADGRLIDARLPGTASLSARVIAAQFKLADQVRISCEAIEPAYDAAAQGHLYLELKSLKLLREASPEELAGTVTAVSWRPGENLLKQLAAAPSARDPAELEHVRAVNLEFAAKLPNFVADETAKRYGSTFASDKWVYQDTVEAEIAFNGARVGRQRIRVNGRPWNRPFLELPGYIWAVWFGLELRPLFSPDCSTTIDYEGREESHGQMRLAYRFASPPNGCFVGFGVRNPQNRYVPARTGRFLVEDPGGHVRRFETETAGFPKDFPMERVTVVETWDYVKIGDATFLVPVDAEIVALTANGVWSRVVVEFRNHRHFDASTNIIFH